MLKMYKEAAVLSPLINILAFFVMTEVTLMLCWFYRAAQILCTLCHLCVVRCFQHHLMVCVISAIWKLSRMYM